MHTSTIQEYRNKVVTAANSRDGKDPIFNGSLKHASIVMEAMFRFADKSVHILTGSLNPEVYAQYDVVTAARDFLLYKEDREVRILMEAEDVAWLLITHPLLLVLNQAKREREDAFQVRRVPKSYQEKYKYHFTVMDDDCIRYEEDRTVPAAITVFGRKASAKHLQAIFEIIWKSAKPFEVVS